MDHFFIYLFTLQTTTSSRSLFLATDGLKATLLKQERHPLPRPLRFFQSLITSEIWLHYDTYVVWAGKRYNLTKIQMMVSMGINAVRLLTPYRMREDETLMIPGGAGAERLQKQTLISHSKTNKAVSMRKKKERREAGGEIRAAPPHLQWKKSLHCNSVK